jgi:hypothetical protein
MWSGTAIGRRGDGTHQSQLCLFLHLGDLEPRRGGCGMWDVDMAWPETMKLRARIPAREGALSGVYFRSTIQHFNIHYFIPIQPIQPSLEQHQQWQARQRHGMSLLSSDAP